MNCPKCGISNEKKAKVCEGCETKLKRSKKIGPVLATGVIGAVLLIGGASFGIFKALQDDEEPKIKPEVSEEIEPITPIEDIEVVEEDTPDITPKQVDDVEVVESTKSPVSRERDKVAIIKEMLPRVFTILTDRATGSGFLFKKGGYIVTNAHVVAGSIDVTVRNSEGKDTMGQIIGISDKYDVALIKVEDYPQLEALEIEQSETPIGSEVIALGSPHGYENSATIGYLTGSNRNFDLNFKYEKIYQIDAQIDSGSSGGPLLDASTGKVIGINSLVSTENRAIGFSIPMYSMYGLINSWVNQPMSREQVRLIFPLLEDFPDGYEDYTGEDYSEYLDNDSLNSFITSYLEFYELALYYGDYSWVKDQIHVESAAELDVQGELLARAGQKNKFEFTETTIKGIEIMSDYALITTSEAYNDIDSTGNTLSGSREMEYTIALDENLKLKIISFQKLN